MTVTFETRDYGEIEVTRDDPTGGGAGRVYFRRQDYEAPVDQGGVCFDSNGVPFRVVWPVRGLSPDAVLEVTVPRAIGFATPKAGVPS